MNENTPFVTPSDDRPLKILNMLLYTGRAARRTIIQKLELHTDAEINQLDKDIMQLRKNGMIRCSGQSYTITQAGVIATLPPMHVCGIITSEGVKAAIITDRGDTAEIYGRMQVTAQNPAAFCTLLKINCYDTLDPSHRPDGPAPVAPAPPIKYHVMLTCPIPSLDIKIRVIKEIRTYTALSLKNAKDLTDGLVDCDIATMTDVGKAEALRDAIKAVGANAYIVTQPVQTP